MIYRDLMHEAPEVNDEERLEMNREYMKPYIFYRKSKTYTECFCTSCLKSYTLRRSMAIESPQDEEQVMFANNINRGDPIRCFLCGRIAIAKTTGANRGRLAEWHYLCRWYSADSGNTVYAVCGELGSGFGRVGMSIEEMSEHYGGALWLPLHVVRYRKGEITNVYYNCDGTWSYSEKLTEPKCCISGGLYPQYAYFEDINAKEALKDTFMRHYLPSEYREQPEANSYHGRDGKCFLMYAAKYPTIEMIMKIGGNNIVRDIVYGCHYKRAIDLDGRNAAEVFRTDGNTAAIIRHNIKKLDVATLQAFRHLRNMFPKAKIDDALKICSFTNNNNYIKIIALLRKTGLTPAKYYNYLDKQGGFGGCWHCPNTAADGLYYDYIKECEQLKYDLKDSQINRPKDLRAAHERTSSAVNAIIAEQEAKKLANKQRKYKEIYQKYVRDYEYSDGEFCIIVPKSAAEIIKEGKDQHHCVAGYAERHITGKLAILFMRRCDKPETALYTIEMDKHSVVQIRGAHNITKMTESEKLFWVKWQEWCKLPMSEKHPKVKKKSA
ncbi:MAG: PcfJ domain-containing protein [Oscillospiraceae bacterium]|nr:PcfJ domain-containing protein [Oscillospiraceae bacterium]